MVLSQETSERIKAAARKLASDKALKKIHVYVPEIEMFLTVFREDREEGNEQTDTDTRTAASKETSAPPGTEESET